MWSGRSKVRIVFFKSVPGCDQIFVKFGQKITKVCACVQIMIFQSSLQADVLVSRIRFTNSNSVITLRGTVSKF